MPEDLQVLDLGVSVEVSTRFGSRLQGADNQPLAVCDKTHVVAIANGRFVDLYGFRAEDPNRLAFLTQIALGDYVNRLPSGQNVGGDCQDIRILLATCVLFPVVGFLLVGGVVVAPELEFQDSSTVESNATFLLGFRLYSGSASQFVHSVEDKSPCRAPISVQVHFSFLEPVVGVSSTGIRTLLKCRDEMTPDSGAVAILFDNSGVFGIFRWNERFSDRLVCLAELTQFSKPLVTASTSDDGHYLVFGDAEGRLSLLDFRDFPWDGYGVSPKDHRTTVGKRVRLGMCSRSGVLARDNPLEQVRVVYTAAGTDANCGYTCIRWWTCGREKEFVLAGKQNGSLNVFQRVRKENDRPNGSAMELKVIQIYPGLASGMHDAIRSISEPLKACESTSKSYSIEFCTISDMRWRVWRVKAENIGSSVEQHRLKWPSVKDSLEFPVFMIKECAGSVLLKRSTSFSRAVAGALSAVSSHNTVRGPISLVIAEKQLQAMALPTKSPSPEELSDFESDVRTSVTEDNAYEREDDEDNGVEEARKESVITVQENDKNEQHSSVPTTIQDKYRLPPMEWKAKSSTSDALSCEESPREDGGLDGARNAQHTAKLSRVDYDQRVASVIQRVDTLSGVMKAMRTSFRLFSSDVQQHMNLFSEQLEELNRRVAHCPPETS